MIFFIILVFEYCIKGYNWFPFNPIPFYTLLTALTHSILANGYVSTRDGIWTDNPNVLSPFEVNPTTLGLAEVSVKGVIKWNMY